METTIETRAQTSNDEAIVEPTVAGERDREEARELPLDTRFELGHRITPLQQAFLEENGFLVFRSVAKRSEVERVFWEIEQIERRWLDEGRNEVNGIPLFIGRDPDGRPFIQRFPFSSTFSEYMHAFVRDERFYPIRSLIGRRTRVGDREKDGLVFNRNLNVKGSAYERLGWHTDGLRDLFMLHPDWPYVRTPGPMLNVGMHFDRIRAEDGGLRLLPGSHSQGFLSMLAKKPYFVWHRPDRLELAVETEPGDVTVHDGRMWHRVERSPHHGWPSLRRTMYVPYLVDTCQPKHEGSRTPFYHHLGRGLRALKRVRDRLS
jgi:phytanoyl-CoA hydroxylase